MKTRSMGWKEWNVSNPREVIFDIRDKVAGGDIYTQLLVLEACVEAYPEISSYLYESLVHKVSYDKMMVHMKKVDFYAYRRKAVALYLIKVGTNKQA